MKKKYIFYNAIVTFVALVLMFSLFIVVTKNHDQNQAEKEIQIITEIYASNYDVNFDYSNSVDENIRITIIDSTGKVISDSSEDIDTLDNHIDREEIVAALNNNPKTCIRKSDSTDVKMIYYALKAYDGDNYIFVRISMPLSNILNLVLRTIPSLLLILFFALTLSIIISYFFSKNILYPLKLVKDNLINIKNGEKLSDFQTTYDEDINKILLEINDIGDKLKLNFIQLKDNEAQLDYVLNNISNGIIAFDENERIKLINKTAGTIFNINDAENKTLNYLSLDIILINKIRSILLDGKNQFFEYYYNGNYYVCNLMKIKNDIYILVLNDITEAKNNEIIRSEFFANASHELKTPLTAIKGFTEVIMFQNTDESLKKPLESINKESNRILILIEDMLKLSKLENVKDITWNAVDLLQLSIEIKEVLQPLYESKNVSLKIEGKASFNGEKEHFYELIKNLVENSIKYNIDNGEVKIVLNQTDSEVTIEVIDNGIGIDVEDRNRIFERFYRVNKSRSRNTGGTGLGLSIVKHITQIYNGNIMLSSTLGKGTSIKIIFSK
ncbi:MAG: ATP-binding protein [Bacilli bacterium]|jgi:two-component system phosphate regulon sensor histidine kinase PhoR